MKRDRESVIMTRRTNISSIFISFNKFIGNNKRTGAYGFLTIVSSGLIKLSLRMNINHLPPVIMNLKIVAFVKLVEYLKDLDMYTFFL